MQVGPAAFSKVANALRAAVHSFTHARAAILSIPIYLLDSTHYGFTLLGRAYSTPPSSVYPYLLDYGWALLTMALLPTMAILYYQVGPAARGHLQPASRCAKARRRRDGRGGGRVYLLWLYLLWLYLHMPIRVMAP